MEELAGREAVRNGDFEPAIEVEDLVVRYGRKVAVDGLSFAVPRGSVYGFLGPNGAGKTTTIKTLMGFQGPGSGSVRVLGHDVVEESLEVRARVGFVGETSSLYGYMSAQRHGKLCRSLEKSWDQNLFERYLDFFRLPPTLVSVVFRDVIASAIATPLVLTFVLLFIGPAASDLLRISDRFIWNPGQMAESFILPLYWTSGSLFVGENLAATSFLVCAIAAAVPLLAALWIFNRKAY